MSLKDIYVTIFTTKRKLPVLDRDLSKLIDAAEAHLMTVPVDYESERLAGAIARVRKATGL